VKVLADTGEFTKKLHLKVHAISAGARAKVEAAGGTVEVIAAQ
jgi:large subunit ribosomal protein L15